ncbi:MAG TPA: glycosyltransferase family 1 protein, partial [bacterium]|nr:glycosyltransferase family 1 protein [bacterium]
KHLSKYLNQINTLFSNLHYFFKEWKIISSEKPVVILLRYNLLNVTLPFIARIKKIPLVIEVNAPMAYESQKFSGHLVKLPWIPKLTEWLNLALSDCVIVVSNELKNYYRNWRLCMDKFAVIPNGVDKNIFHPEIDSQRIITNYKLKGKIVIGFVGSFHFWHGIESLRDFINAILGKYQNTAFLLVGEGPMKNKLQATFSDSMETERVIFPGYIPYNEISEYIAAMDIVLAPYPNFELFYFSPLKLFEYLAVGKPVVASRIGQIAEIIIDQQNGMLFTPGNYQEMLDVTTQLIEDQALRLKIGKRSRQLIESSFNWDITASKVEQNLKRALKVMNQ